MDRGDTPITDGADGVKDGATPGPTGGRRGTPDVGDTDSGASPDGGDSPGSGDVGRPVGAGDAGSGAGSTGRVIGVVVLYVGVRLVVVAVLAGVMVLLGLPLLLALLIGIVLALPISLVLFRPLRARMNTEVEAATRVRRERRESLRAELRGD